MRIASGGLTDGKEMASSSLKDLQELFERKSRDGEPLSQNELAYVQYALEALQSQSGVFTDPEDDDSQVFQAASTYGLSSSQPVGATGYDPHDILKKYQKYYSQTDNHQATKTKKNLILASPTKLAALSSDHILKPVIRMVANSQPPEAIIQPVSAPAESQSVPLPMEQKPAAGSLFATGTALAICNILGENRPAVPPKVEVTKPCVKPLEPIGPIMATPSPLVHVRPFAAHLPNDSETPSKRPCVTIVEEEPLLPSFEFPELPSQLPSTLQMQAREMAHVSLPEFEF